MEIRCALGLADQDHSRGEHLPGRQRQKCKSADGL